MLWCYVVSVLTLYEFYKFTEPADRVYIPKSQRNRASRLLNQWGQLLKSWLKQGTHYIKSVIKAWETRKKIRHRMSCAKRSGFHQYPSPQVRKRLREKGGMSKALFVYTAIAMSAATPHPTKATRFDTDSGPVGIDNRCTACISH